MTPKLVWRKFACLSNNVKPFAAKVAFRALERCGCLLIREAKARWNLQWSILFLGIAYAIVEEGLTTKAFFNPSWHTTGPEMVMDDEQFHSARNVSSKQRAGEPFQI